MSTYRLGYSLAWPIHPCRQNNYIALLTKSQVCHGFNPRWLLYWRRSCWQALQNILRRMSSYRDRGCLMFNKGIPIHEKDGPYMQ